MPTGVFATPKEVRGALGVKERSRCENEAGAGWIEGGMRFVAVIKVFVDAILVGIAGGRDTAIYRSKMSATRATVRS